MSLYQWLLDAGADWALWDPKCTLNVAYLVADNECRVYEIGAGYRSFRVPEALAPAIIKLIEEHYPKPPSEEEGQALAAELVNCLGPSGLAQFIQSISTLGEAPTARAVLQCAVRAYRTENGLDGAYAPALQRAERWLEQNTEVEL